MSKKALWMTSGRQAGRVSAQLIQLANDLGLGGIIEVTSKDILDLETKLAEQSEIIMDLRQHLKAVIGIVEEDGIPFCSMCETGQENHSDFCLAQHCLSYTSSYQDKV